MRSVTAAQQATEKATLKEEHRQEREEHRKRFKPYLDLEQWLRMQEQSGLAEQ